MSIWRRSQGPLRPGVYDEILSAALEARLARLEADAEADVASLGDGSDVDEQLVTLVRDAARFVIEGRGSAQEKISIARAMLAPLDDEGAFRPGEADLRDQILRGIFSKPAGLPARRLAPPRGSLLSSGLVTNAHGESVLSHLASEFESSDRIDLVCSFVKLSGLDAFRSRAPKRSARWPSA